MKMCPFYRGKITTRLESGAVVLLVIYSKSAADNIPAHVLKQIAEEMGHVS